MNTLTSLAALVAFAVIATMSESAWSGEATEYGSAAPVEQMPAPASPVAPGGYGQTWPQPPRWQAPQQIFGRMPYQYLPSQQFQHFPQRPAMAPAARENPLNAALQQTQEQLSATSSELAEVRDGRGAQGLRRVRGDVGRRLPRIRVPERGQPGLL